MPRAECSPPSQIVPPPRRDYVCCCRIDWVLPYCDWLCLGHLAASPTCPRLSDKSGSSRGSTRSDVVCWRQLGNPRPISMELPQKKKDRREKRSGFRMMILPHNYILDWCVTPAAGQVHCIFAFGGDLPSAFPKTKKPCFSLGPKDCFRLVHHHSCRIRRAGEGRPRKNGTTSSTVGRESICINIASESHESGPLLRK